MLTNIGYDLPRVFLTEYAEKDCGIDGQRAAWLVSAWGIANTAGRVLIGWAADRRWALGRRLHIYIVSMIICGVVNMMANLYTNYASLLIYASLFGATLSKCKPHSIMLTTRTIVVCLQARTSV